MASVRMVMYVGEWVEIGHKWKNEGSDRMDMTRCV